MSPLAERGQHARVLDALGHEIVEGRPPVGGVLPLDEIGTRFGVSRSVLREAVRVLQSLGMVEPRQRVGTLVQPRSRWDLLHPQLVEWRGRSREHASQRRELLELRLGLEPVAARLTATAGDPLRAALVHQAATAMLEACASGDGHRYLEADIAFHTGLLGGSGNAIIAHFATTVEAVLRTRTAAQQGALTAASQEAALRHLTLAEALVAADPEAASRAGYELVAGTIAEGATEDPAHDAARPA